MTRVPYHLLRALLWVVFGSWMLQAGDAHARLPEATGDLQTDAEVDTSDVGPAQRGAKLKAARRGSAEFLGIYAEQRAQPLWLGAWSTPTSGDGERAQRWFRPRAGLKWSVELGPDEDARGEGAARSWRRLGGWLSLLSAAGAGVGIGLYSADRDVTLPSCPWRKSASRACPATWAGRELGVASVVGGAALGVAGAALALGPAGRDRDRPTRTRARLVITPRSVAFKLRF